MKSMNVAVVVGTLSSDPRVRSLPSGSELFTYEVTTTGPEGGRTTVPVVWFDPSRPPAVQEGDVVAVVGRIRRRFFRSGAATASRTEVEASVVARAGTRRAGRALDEVRDTFEKRGSLE
jgi:single-strand DNA-binding protein